MAEKSICLPNISSGIFMAARQSSELDELGNPRLVEIIDFSTAHFTSPIGNAIRGNSSLITTPDSFDLTALPSDLINNLITVGDRSMLCVAVEQTVSGGSVTITPIIYDNESTPGVVSILPPKIFTQPYAFRRGASSGNYVLPTISWDVAGAYKIGLHCSAFTGTSNTWKVYGWMI